MASRFDDLIPQQSAPQQSGSRFADLVPQGAAPKPAGRAPSGLEMGVFDPIHGGAQLLTKILPDSVVQAGNEFNNWLADKTGFVAPVPAGGVDQMVREREENYQAARRAEMPVTMESLVTGRQPDPGFDWGRLVGNVVSPANAALAYVAGPVNAASTVGKALQGARAGAVGAAAAPVTGDGDFVTEKATQIAAGGAGGAVLTPLASKVGERAVRRFVKPSPAALNQQADEIVNAGIERLQREGAVLPPAQIPILRQQVLDALKDGVELDVAAMARKMDFNQLGMQPTLGQVTRAAGQFSREKNLRGVAGVGDPLLARFDDQARRMQELVAQRSAGAADDFTAGEQLMGAVRKADEGLRSNVTKLYTEARNSAGKELDIPLQGLAQDYAKVLDDFGDKVPSGVRNAFERLGLMTGNQKKVFNFGDADKLLKVINDNQSNDPATNRALSYLRESVKRAATDVDASGGPFAPAVEAARKRFELHRAAPALKAAVDGDVSAQDFVRRFLINGKAEEVRELAKVMPAEAVAESRRQFGAALERAAFGANVTGDKAFAQESFNRFLQQPGMRQKLAAFFNPQEVEELFRIGRVGAYIGSFPANSTVNTSNTAAELANLVNRVPGLPAGVGLLQAARNAAGNQMAVNSALRANPAQRPSNLSPEQLALLSRLLSGGAAGTAGAAGVGLGE